MIIEAFVDWSALWQASVAAVLSGVGVAFAFSLAIYGAAQSSDQRRLGHPAAALGATVLFVVGMVLSLAAVVAGLVLMISG